MAESRRIPHDVFRYILSFKDPTKQVGVKGGVQTDSATCVPVDFEYPPVLGKIYYGRRWRRDFWGSYCEFIDLWAYVYPNNIISAEWQSCFKSFRVNTLGRYMREQEPEKHEKALKLQTAEWTRLGMEWCDEGSGPHQDALWLQCEACGPDIELYICR